MIDFEFDFRYENEKVLALKNAQGKIGRGKCIVLCGGSGCGKSTLLRYESEIHRFRNQRGDAVITSY